MEFVEEANNFVEGVKKRLDKAADKLKIERPLPEERKAKTKDIIHKELQKELKEIANESLRNLK